MKKEADYLLESSWEVCNKVGGIYTVLYSKAEKTKAVYGEKYFLIGPYLPGKKVPEFEEKSPPPDIQKTFLELEKQNITCYFGTWAIKGEPNAILIDFSRITDQIDSVKTTLWEKYRVDSLNSGWEFNEPIIFSWAIGKFIEEFSKNCYGKIISQFHEWMTGAGLLYLKDTNPSVGTVFTTHATMLGRSISGSGRKLFGEMENINPEEEAYKIGVHSKFQMERACAKEADIFTTVSDTTSMEAEIILGRKPDIITYNGLDMDEYPNFEDRAVKHKMAKERIKDMIAAYFFPYQNFDLDETFIYYTFGRYEFHNKGIDTTIRALSKVNQALKQKKSNKTVVMFFWIPAGTAKTKTEILENKAFYDDMKTAINRHSMDIKRKILNAIINKKAISKIKLIDKEFEREVRRDVMNFTKEGQPPICTHELYGENQDAIVGTCRAAGLNNLPEDRVKVIFHPAYLTGTDGLLDLTYYEAMVGGQVGIYPSYYEPWGYTPLETAAFGVSAITTDLAGYGRWLMNKTDQTKKCGVQVLKRYEKTDEESEEELAKILLDYVLMTKKQRMNLKLDAKRIADMSDWKTLVEHYIEAHNGAMKKAEQR